MLARSRAEKRTYFHTTIALIGTPFAVASLIAAPNILGLAGAGLALLMVAIAVIDSHSFIIPDRLNLAALALAFANSVFSAAEEATEAVALAALRGCVLSLAFLGLRIVYRNFRKREGLGLGDVKLAGVAGAWLDWQTIAITVEIAAVAALVTYAARQWALSRSLRLTSHLPFGLFFAPAIWLGWFFETTLFTPV